MAPKKKRSESRRTMDSDSDEGEMNGTHDAGDPNGLLPQQDPEKRRAIRHEYRELLQEADEKKNELSNYKNVDQLRDLVQRSNAVYEKVEHTREAALDSQLMVGISQVTVNAVRDLPADFVSFLPSEFAEKIKSKIGGGEGEAISQKGWLDIGEKVTFLFQRNPPLKFMLGSFQRDPPQRKEKKQRNTQQADKDNKEVIKPKQVERTSELGRKEATTEEVDYVNSELKKLYNMFEKPLCYFEFITDPDSFGHTIENMFYVSFLVKDGHCRVFLDDDKLPVIEPLKQDLDEERRQDQPKQQVVMTLTQENWKEIIDTFNITAALLKKRKNRGQAGGDVSSGVRDSDSDDVEVDERSVPPPKKKR